MSTLVGWKDRTDIEMLSDVYVKVAAKNIFYN